MHWTDPLRVHANEAVAAGTQLAARGPQDHALLRQAVQHLHDEVHSPAAGDPGQSRAQIAMLAAYIRVAASCQQEHLIPLWEPDARAAALRLERAAWHVLQALEGDYGDLPDTDWSHTP